METRRYVTKTRREQSILMYIVWRIIPIEVGQKIEEIAPGSVSLISIGLFGRHFGYMPVFLSYEEAYKAFPHSMVVRLPIYEVKLTDENIIPNTEN